MLRPTVATHRRTKQKANLISSFPLCLLFFFVARVCVSFFTLSFFFCFPCRFASQRKKILYCSQARPIHSHAIKYRNCNKFLYYCGLDLAQTQSLRGRIVFFVYFFYFFFFDQQSSASAIASSRFFTSIAHVVFLPLLLLDAGAVTTFFSSSPLLFAPCDSIPNPRGRRSGTLSLSAAVAHRFSHRVFTAAVPPCSCSYYQQSR